MIRSAIKQKQSGDTAEQIAWHGLPLGDVFMRLGSKRDGLTKQEAENRLRHFGPNALALQKRRSRWRMFLRQFFSPLAVILIAAGSFTVFAGSYLDAVVIFLAVVLNGAIGFFHESGAEKSLAALKKLEVEYALALRDGNYGTVRAAEIVPGDVILLRPGDKAPADARLVHSFGLEMDESVLTGESAAVAKAVTVASEDALIFERKNIVFAGTAVLDGRGEAAVFGTGRSSEMGRISQLLKKLPVEKTPFEKKISRLGHFIGLAVVLISVLILAWGVVEGRDVKEMFLVAVAIAVAAVPESLPVAVTVILVVGMKRILKEKGLVRSLAAAETLGSASVILTDKTGTLTRGEMQVAKVLTPERRSGVLELNAAADYASNHLLVLTYGMLVSEAIIENPADEIHNLVIKANAVEKALVLAGMQAGLDFGKLNQKFKKIGQVPFNSVRKFGLSFREDPSSNVWVIAAGAPDVLLNHVKSIQILNRFEKAMPFEMAAVKESVDALAKNGLRVIAVCSKKIDRADVKSNFSKNELTKIISDLSLAGLVGLKDPVRDDVKSFLAMSRRAGLRTVMVTGDHSLTARSVAKEVGILPKSGGVAEVMEGKDIDVLETRELAARVRQVDIFSRATPEHKLKITEAWRSQGEVVAVVGDGVNDAPALRRADIGVALGTGVDLAKDSADMILLDNGFDVIVKAVQEGRVILDNIKKVVAYLLSTGLTEVGLVSLSLFFGLPLPITAVQILWVNLIHEIFPAAALALDPAEKDVMDFKPKQARSPLLDGFMRFLITVIGGVSAVVLFWVFIFFNASFDNAAYARSVVFVGLGLSALFSSFSIRSLRKPIWEIPFFENRYLIASTAAGAALMAAAVYLPPLQALLRTQPLGLLEWLIVFGVGIINVILVEVAKWLFVRRKRSGH